MSLRILHTLRTADSGAEKSIRDVVELSVAQRRLGHTVELLTLDRSELDGLSSFGVPVHRLGGSVGSYGFNLEFVRWIETHARNYDCVIVHGIWAFNAYGTWRALREASVPYFVFTHGMLDPWYKHHRPFNHFKRWLYWPWGVYPVLRDAHAVLFLSDYERHRSQEAFWLYDCHEFVVRYGTAGVPPGPPDRSLFVEHPELTDRRLFTYLGDASGRTGADCVLRAVQQLVGKGSWNAATMSLVLADLPEESRAEGLRMIHRLGLTSCVRWMGSLTDPERWSLLGASDVLLRPSSYEVSAKAVAESLSAGTPVLLANGVAIWKDVVNDSAGLANEDTSEGFAQLMSRWLALSDEERAGMRVAARRSFDNRFTLEGAANTLTAALYLLIGVHRDSRWDSKPLRPQAELP